MPHGGCVCHVFVSSAQVGLCVSCVCACVCVSCVCVVCVKVALQHSATVRPVGYVPGQARNESMSMCRNEQRLLQPAQQGQRAWAA